MKRSAIVTEARSWIGTKWQHQTSLKGVATDCVGLIRGVYAAATGMPVVGSFDYPATWHLFKNEEKLYNEVKSRCIEIPIEAAKPGDILIFGFGKGPAHHAAIMATSETMIHAWADIHKVGETEITEFWKKNIRAAFQYPGVEDDEGGSK